MIDFTDEKYEGAVRIDDMDEAIVGYYDNVSGVGFIYSYDRCIELMQLKYGFSYTQAVEWYDFNFHFPEDGKPIILFTIED